MPKLNQQGVIAHFFLLVLIGVGLVVGLYLVQHKTNILPKAASTPINTPVTSFILSPNASIINVGGDKLAVKLIVRSDISATNLFIAKINFNKDLLAVTGIDYSNSFIRNWAEQYYDNTSGIISLVGGFPNPGFQTNKDSAGSPMAIIYFQALKTGTASISFSAGSEIYDVINNVNILTVKEPIDISIGSSAPLPTATSISTPKPTSTPAPTAMVAVSPTSVSRTGTITITYSGIPNPNSKDVIQFVTNGMTQIVGSAVWINNCTVGGAAPLGTPKSSGSCLVDLTKVGIPSSITTLNAVLYSGANIGQIIALSNQFSLVSSTPVPTASPIPGNGDGNNDGKVNFADLSILFTDFNKTGSFRKGIDLNGDGVINSFDFSLLRTILIKNGLLKG